jgi:DNA-binding MarR family transcriptional regulator
MPGVIKKRKTTPEVEADYLFRILDIVGASDEALTIEAIQNEDMILAHLTSQKMSRVLARLIEMGLVKKGKSKSLGRMVYKSTAKMQEQGYDVEEDE